MASSTRQRSHDDCGRAVGQIQGTPSLANVLPLHEQAKAYYSQQASLECHDGLLHGFWQLPGCGGRILQLLVPKDWLEWVVQALYGSVGVGHFGVTKAWDNF